MDTLTDHVLDTAKIILSVATLVVAPMAAPFIPIASIGIDILNRTIKVSDSIKTNVDFQDTIKKEQRKVFENAWKRTKKSLSKVARRKLTKQIQSVLNIDLNEIIYTKEEWLELFESVINSENRQIEESEIIKASELFARFYDEEVLKNTSVLRNHYVQGDILKLFSILDEHSKKLDEHDYKLTEHDDILHKEVDVRLRKLEDSSLVTQPTSVLDCFVHSQTHYQLLRSGDGRFAHIDFNDNLFAKAKPIPIMFKETEKSETSEKSLQETLMHYKGNLLFIGDGGIGKTTSLLQIWESFLAEKNELPLYVPLNEYNHETRKADKANVSDFIKLYINECYKLDLESADGPVILLLDGINEISGDTETGLLIEEIIKLSRRLKTRIVLTSRHNLVTIYGLEGFARYDIQPLSEEKIKQFFEDIKEKPNMKDIELPNGWEELLATPMMLTLYVNTCAVQKNVEHLGVFPFKPTQTKGELIYNYLLCQLAKLVTGKQWEDLYSAYIALFWAAPYAAWCMEHKGHFSEEREAMLEQMETYLAEHEVSIRLVAIDFFAEINEYHTIPLLRNKPLKDLLVKTFRLISEENIPNEKKRYTFRHQHFRDFLSAMHIDNALCRALIQKDFVIPEEIKDRVFPPSITDILGGYYEDYQNQKEFKVQTRLHELIERLRGDDTPTDFTIINIINIWRLSRNDRIIGENLSGLDLRHVPMNGILFSSSQVITDFNKSLISDNSFLPQGHSDAVFSVVYNSDEYRVLSASGDNTIKEWDRETGECLHTYEGHAKAVRNAVYSTDGRRVLSASGDNTIKEWDRETGECLHTYEGHAKAVRSAVYSTDGRRVLSASFDKTIKEWDRETEECLHTYKGHDETVFSAVYSADGCRVLSSSFDKTIKEWDRETEECLHTYDHTELATSAIYNIDLFQLLSTSSDRTIKEWHRETGECLYTYGHTELVTSAVYSVDGFQVLSASQDRTIKEWNRKTGKCLHTYRGHDHGVCSAIYSADGLRVLSASGDGTIKEWDRETRECLHTYQGHNEAVYSAVYSADERRVLSSSFDKTIKEWNRETGACLRTYEGYSNESYSAVYSEDGRRVLSTCDRAIYEWDREAGECLRIIQGHSNVITSAVYSMDGHRVLSVSKDNTIREWCRKTGECLRVFEGHVANDEVFGIKKETVKYSGDEHRVLSTCDRAIYEWDRETGECIRVYDGYTGYTDDEWYNDCKGHADNVNSAVYSPDETNVLSASNDCTIKEWDRKTGRCLRTFVGHTHNVNSAVYSADGKLVISASFGGTVKEWDRKTGKCLRTFDGYERDVRSILYSSDGYRILSVSDDNTIKEWDRETSKCICTFEGHTNSVESIVCSKNGHRVLSVSRDNNIKEWDRKTGECLWSSPTYGGIYIVGCDFKDCEFENEELKEMIRIYGGRI